MPLLPYDYLHLVNCPEVVTISDNYCNRLPKNDLIESIEIVFDQINRLNRESYEPMYFRPIQPMDIYKNLQLDKFHFCLNMSSNQPSALNLMSV